MRRCFPKRNGEKGSKTTCPVRAGDPGANTKMQADHSVPSSSWKHKRNQPANVRGTSKAARSPSRRRPWDSARPVNRTTPRISTKSVRPRGHTIDRIGLARTRGVPDAGRQGSKGGSFTRPDPTPGKVCPRTGRCTDRPYAQERFSKPHLSCLDRIHPPRRPPVGHPRGPSLSVSMTPANRALERWPSSFDVSVPRTGRSCGRPGIAPECPLSP